MSNFLIFPGPKSSFLVFGGPFLGFFFRKWWLFDQKLTFFYKFIKKFYPLFLQTNTISYRLALRCFIKSQKPSFLGVFGESFEALWDSWWVFSRFFHFSFFEKVEFWLFFAIMNPYLKRSSERFFGLFGCFWVLIRKKRGFWLVQAI